MSEDQRGDGSTRAQPLVGSPAETPVDETLPPIVQQMLRRGVQLASIRLDANGRWWHEGNPFTNRKLIALFSRSVDRTPGGTWVLRVGRYTYPITVEDTPLFVEACTVDAYPVEAKTVEAKTVEAYTVEANTVEANTVEANTVEANTVEAHTIDGGTLSVRLSDGTEEQVAISGLAHDSAGLVVAVKGGRFVARMMPSVCVDFVERYVIEVGNGFAFESDGRRIALPMRDADVTRV